MNVKSMLAIAMNDIKDLRRNSAMLPILFIPPLLAFLMSKAGGDKTPVSESLPMWIVYGQILVGMNIMAVSLAEEKEKRTLEALLVSPASLIDIILAKLSSTVVICLVIQALTIAVVGGAVGNLASLAVLAIAGTILFILIGLVIGVFSPNQKVAGILEIPIMLFFMLVPLIAGISKGLERLADFLPSSNLYELLQAGIIKEGIVKAHLTDAISLAAWIGVAALACAWALRRQQLQ